MKNETNTDFNITDNDIIQYWIKLFPEIKDRESLDEILQNVSNSSTEYYLDLIKSCNIENSKKFNDSIIEQDLSKYLKSNIDKFCNYVPFFYFFLPIINSKIDSLLITLKGIKFIENLEMFSESIVMHSLDQLFEKAYRVLILEVNISRMAGNLKGDTSEERLNYFSNELLIDKNYIRELYTEYSTLIELLFLTLENYFNYIIEILNNTSKELDNISYNINDGNALGNVVKIETGIGDTHRNGRAVSTIYFNDGLKVVYKPRSLELEEGFQALFHWLKTKKINGFLDIKDIKIYSNKDAGWMEYIKYKDCKNEGEAKNFYIRSGEILFLLYALNAVDFHCENLIASSEYPFLIDLEALFHAEFKDPGSDIKSGVYKGKKIVTNSVQSISLLPTSISKKVGKKEITIDIGGLSASENQISPFKSLSIEDINLDTIRVLQKNMIFKPHLNNPSLGGTFLNSQDYVPQIVEGFELLYRWVINNKEEFKEAVEGLFKGMRSRLIFRPTYFYGQLLKISSHPDFMREGCHREVLLHRIGIKALKENSAILKSEFEDLLHCDIPIFYTSINDNYIVDSKGIKYGNLLNKSPLSVVEDKIASFCEKDLYIQKNFIEMSYLNKINRQQDLTKIKFPKSFNINSLQPDKWISTATQIGDYILENSISGINDFNKRDRCWIGASLEGDEENIWNANVLGFDLYNGNSGIALFLGYLGTILNRNDFKQAALATMEPIMRFVEQREKDHPYLIGAFNGFSGYFYTLNKLAIILQNTELESFVLNQIECLSELVNGDKVYDVIGGAAGCLAVLTSIYETARSDELRNKVISVATKSYLHLVNEAKEAGVGIAWGGDFRPNYSGFSHGNAGVISYIGKLYKITQDDKISNYIVKALSFERSLFSDKYKNWYSTDEKAGVSNGWCHGAPGILLSKIMLKSCGYKDIYLDDEIKIATRTTCAKGIGNNPTYCHGDLGNLSILRYVAKETQNQKLENKCIQTYQDLFNNVLSKRWKSADMRCTKSYSLMIGLTGIGYSMIKSYSPETVPEFLWLE